ncbi:MAG: YtxH domain-containing protein [Candidatus Saccharibacteria bacterium]
MGKLTKNIAVGAALAGAAGYLAGLLTAPKSGKETRQELRDNGVNTKQEVDKQLTALHLELGKLIDDTKGKGDDLTSKAQTELKKLAEAAKDSKEKLATVMTAIHEGEASDKDLDRALVDAKHAIDHIKAYLKK